MKTELSANWRWRFRGGERARRRRLLGVDGGADALLLRESAAAKEMKMGGRVGQAGARGAQDSASSVRKPVARGQLEQKAGDARHPRGGVLLNRSGTVAAIQRTKGLTDSAK